MSTVIVITEPAENELTVTIEADPPIPLTADGVPDVESPLFRPEHAAAIVAAQTLHEHAGRAEWRHLIKPWED